MKRRVVIPLVLTAAVALVSAESGSGRPAAAPAQTTPGCVMKVVSCNYAPLYNGTFSWTKILKSANSEHKENVQVSVQGGVANCIGTVTETENGRTLTGTIRGSGLFAVEFEQVSKKSFPYTITAACPTAAWPAIPADGVEATKSQPAELGHNDQNSDKQPAQDLAQSTLVGSIQYPAPETDPVNGVTGSVSISWSLKRK